jgi:hypothetical protein
MAFQYVDESAKSFSVLSVRIYQIDVPIVQVVEGIWQFGVADWAKGESRFSRD